MYRNCREPTKKMVFVVEGMLRPPSKDHHFGYFGGPGILIETEVEAEHRLYMGFCPVSFLFML